MLQPFHGTWRQNTLDHQEGQESQARLLTARGEGQGL